MVPCVAPFSGAIQYEGWAADLGAAQALVEAGGITLIRVGALGERWFTAPAPIPQGLYFPGFSATDANPDMGDSAIVETLRLGAFAMVASPAVAQFVGVGGWAVARRYTVEMLEITAGRHPHLLLPMLDGLGVATGIDVRKVVETEILPWINTGIAHRQAGVGHRSASALCRRHWRALCKRSKRLPPPISRTARVGSHAPNG